LKDEHSQILKSELQKKDEQNKSEIDKMNNRMSAMKVEYDQDIEHLKNSINELTNSNQSTEIEKKNQEIEKLKEQFKSETNKLKLNNLMLLEKRDKEIDRLKEQNETINNKRNPLII